MDNLSSNTQVSSDVSAKRINEQHRLAKTSADAAIEHAVLCGELLAEQKARLDHGEFQPWIEQHCEFSYRTAAGYMKAAKTPDALEFGSLRKLLSPKNEEPKQPQKCNGVALLKEETSGKIAQIDESMPGAKPEPIVQIAQVPAPAEILLQPDWQPEDDEDEALVRAEAEYTASIDKVMAADDKLAAAHAEIKRQAAEIAVLKISRDGYMNGKAAITELLKKEQRKNERLEKEIKKLREAK